MNKRLQAWLIGVVVIGAIVFFALRPKSVSEAEKADEETPQESLAQPVENQQAADVAQNPESPVENPEEAARIRREKFTTAIRGLGACLQMTAEPSEPLEPSFDNLSNLLRGVTGDAVVRNDDWFSTLLELPNGERRRIRVEMDYAGEEFIRKLKYEIIRENAEPESIPIAQEQSENPSETFIASLESDGKPILREKRSRVYYVNGAEIIFNEKNGLMSTLEISMVEGKKFKCSQLDTQEGSCVCQ